MRTQNFAKRAGQKLYEIPVILHDFLEMPTLLEVDIADDVPLSCELLEASDTDSAYYLQKISLKSIDSFT